MKTDGDNFVLGDTSLRPACSERGKSGSRPDVSPPRLLNLYVQDADFTLYLGDALEVLRELPDESVHMCVTSPPFFGLRDYSACKCVAEGRLEIHEDGRGDRHTPGGAIAFHRQRQPNPNCSECGGTGKQKDMVARQIGLEASPDEWVARLVDVFREVRRVLRADGTLWLEIGDSYAASTKGSGGPPEASNLGMPADGGPRRMTAQGIERAIASKKYEPRKFVLDRANLKQKDLIGAPWLLAFALRADGWYLRSDIIWARPNPMPESVRDRPTKSHSYVFLLSKSPRYFFDQEAVREPHSPDGRHITGRTSTEATHENHRLEPGERRERWPNGGRNLRSVWTIPTEPLPDEHYAAYPQKLVERCILAGTSERGCCPECRAPWERETVVGYDAQGRTTNGPRSTARRHESPGRDVRMVKDVSTTGWRPTCECALTEGDAVRSEAMAVAPKPSGVANSPSVSAPCVVLDPFLGSGTTALVARRHGRRTIGIELSPAYAAMAARRLQQLSLLA